MKSSSLPTLALCIITSIGFIQGLQATVVTNNLNDGPGSLRAAIAGATAGETISFAPNLNGATITLTTGELSITGLQLTIDASPLPDGIKISGNNSSRIFQITENANVSLISLELFNGKSLNENGGGILALQSQLNCVNITIRNCASSLDGGGLWANSVAGSIDRCSFIGNDSGSFGGGIFLIGSTPWIIKNSVISGNRSVIGGGIANLNASPAMINCTIQGNSGSGIQLEFASAPNLRNTIVWGNLDGGGSIGSQQIRNGSSSTASADVKYCLVEGLSGTLNLDGTLPANNPKFIKPATPINSGTPPTANLDLRVFINSPVIDVGDNASNTTFPNQNLQGFQTSANPQVVVNNSNPTVMDLAGKSRIQNTVIDLGAFEAGYVTFNTLYPSLTPTADANGNGLSNFLEYATGIDPTAPDDPSARLTFSTSGGFIFMTGSQRSNSADVSAFWETSTSLDSLSWLKMIHGINFTIESTSYPTPSRQQSVLKLLDGGNCRFYRQAFSDVN